LPTSCGTASRPGASCSVAYGFAYCLASCGGGGITCLVRDEERGYICDDEENDKRNGDVFAA
jgi:hypothetical protein